MDTVQELPKVYQPAEVEPRWYSAWETAGLFSPGADDGRPPYSIVIPPPNITGSLHMGHALNNTIQDIMTRTKRMQGFAAVWFPGTDHAGIATQMMVEKELAKGGQTRHDLGREAFLERVWAWREEYGNTIVGQLKRLGASCDWSRASFTMDPERSLAVRVAFHHYYKKGHIYRGKRIVNWCPRCLTALSDLEVEHETDNNGKIYHLRYPLEDNSAEGITIATTRPETILADVAVAVHPDDERYKPLVGKNAVLPLVGRKLRIIADAYVEKDFGSGALKVTPAHDQNDFDIGERHGLERLVCMDEKGVINDLVIAYEGMDRFACRKKIVADLAEGGFLVKEEDYAVALGKCSRCHTVLEPYLSDQWFMRMDKLAAPALQVVQEGKIRFFPERYTRLYLEWMQNIRDWCISRQLWWGHRIPVWTCLDCHHQESYVDPPDRCPNCKSLVYEQDTDVLDTWFSSALWPLSTMGWPQASEDLERFYPTALLSTARDILYLWVARMVMAGLEFKHEVPFRDVYVHATVLAKDGTRMSKSKGNGVDPLELFDKYGTDATRFGLAWMTGQGQDVRFSEERIQQARNFANKIWNASRLVRRFLPDAAFEGVPGQPERWLLEDRWIVSRLQRAVKRVTGAIEQYDFEIAARELYEFFWDDFCDWYLEMVKPAFYEREDIREREKLAMLLDYVMSTFLRLLHPLMPFITEEIWQGLPGDRGYVMVARWPEYHENLVSTRDEEHMALVMDAVRAVRNLRAEMGVPVKEETEVFFVFPEEAPRQALASMAGALKLLAKVNPAQVVDVLEQKPRAALSTRITGGEIFLPVGAGIDLSKEVERLSKELTDLEASASHTRAKLDKPGFADKAKPEVVERERQRLVELEENRTKVTHRLEVLRSLT